MQKLFTLFVLSNTLILVDNTNNFKQHFPDDFIEITEEELPRLPNNVSIQRPLPNAAYIYVKAKYKKELKSTDNFLNFLKKRADFQDHELESQLQLLGILTQNYKKNKNNLTTLTLPMAAFAQSTIDLLDYQLKAEEQIYPNNIALTRFERNYPFSLTRISPIKYFFIKESQDPTKMQLVQKMIIKKWSRFLLQKF